MDPIQILNDGLIVASNALNVVWQALSIIFMFV